MDDERFFKKLRAHDPQAQNELIRTFNPRIFVYFRNRIKGENNYEDLVQEVFSAFFNGLDQGKLAGAAWIAPFMFGIAKRVLYNYFYKQKKNNEIQKNVSAVCELSSDFTEADRMENQKLGEVLQAADRRPAAHRPDDPERLLPAGKEDRRDRRHDGPLPALRQRAQGKGHKKNQE